MSKELIERIENYRRLSFDSDDLDAIDLLTDCQQRIAELEERKTRDMHDLIVVLGERDKRIEELEQGVRYYQELRQFDQQTLALASVEQENARLQGRVEAEAQSGMQSLRTQENLFGAKLDALQAQLEAAEGVLRTLHGCLPDQMYVIDEIWTDSEPDDDGFTLVDFVEYFRAKEGKEKA